MGIGLRIENAIGTYLGGTSGTARLFKGGKGLCYFCFSGASHTRETHQPMQSTLTRTTRRRLDIQGFERVEDAALAPVAPWLRLAFGLCAVMAALGTALASPLILLLLLPIASLAAVFPVHPFDLLYNYGIRFLTGTGPLPRRGSPSRFACGLGAVWLVPTAWAFQTGQALPGYVLGALLTGVAVLVSTMDICIPSLMYRAVFGFPRRRDDGGPA